VVSASKRTLVTTARVRRLAVDIYRVIVHRTIRVKGNLTLLCSNRLGGPQDVPFFQESRYSWMVLRLGRQKRGFKKYSSSPNHGFSNEEKAKVCVLINGYSKALWIARGLRTTSCHSRSTSHTFIHRYKCKPEQGNCHAIPGECHSWRLTNRAPVLFLEHICLRGGTITELQVLSFVKGAIMHQSSGQGNSRQRQS